MNAPVAEVKRLTLEFLERGGTLDLASITTTVEHVSPFDQGVIVLQVSDDDGAGYAVAFFVGDTVDQLVYCFDGDARVVYDAGKWL